jgi:uncharacterized BrkB/YihY/UPF0761 family membrane protein
VPPDPDPGAAPQPGFTDRIKTTVATAKDKAEVARERVEAARPDHPTVDIAFTAIERDVDHGGGLIAGALAYRFFFWVLPFVLVLVGGLGFLSSASSTAPQDLAKDLGFVGLAAKSISDASTNAERTRFWALLVGLPALYFASLAFVKALVVAHGLIWGVPERKVAYKKPVAAAVMTGVLVAAFVIIGVEQHVRQQSEGPGLIIIAAFTLLAASLWLWVSWKLPHADATVWQLVPGAVLVAFGIQVVHVIIVYYISRKVAHSSSTYGTLGSATAILLGLFFIARVIVFGAGLNAELHRRRKALAALAAQEAEVSGSSAAPAPS